MKHEPGYDAFKKWERDYGPVHTFWLGEQPLVAITDFEVLQETFVKDPDTFSARPKFGFMEVTKNGDYGVVFIDGDLWREQRRFAIHVLKNLGMNVQQEKILSEAHAMVEQIHHDLKAGVTEHDIAAQINLSVGSVINNMLFGYRFEGKTEKEFYYLKDLLSKLDKAVGSPWMLVVQDCLEYVKYLPVFSHYYKIMEESSVGFREFFLRQIEEHQARMDHYSEPTDYVEAFLREKAKREEAGEVGGNYSTPQLLGMLFDLWLAGQETTATTLIWGVLYLIQNLDVQEKLHEELDAVVGCDRLVTMDDRPNLHYTVACINEIQRIANVLPINVRHAMAKDVLVRGHLIPKGTIVVPQISVVHYNDKIFPNPEKFDPTRFLDANGKVKKVDENLPFSLGKRQCAGEGLARMELFLITANLFNQFTIKAVPDKPPSLYKKASVTVSPQPFVCSIDKRY